MAKAILTPSLTGIRGRMGSFVYRQQHGQTVILPHSAPKDRPSKAQKANRNRFSEAKDYAKAVLADPLRRECYRRLAVERKCPSNALLIANFLNPPTIELVELSEYRGRVGDRIRILAEDPIEVVSVTVTLRAISTGKIVESGNATRDHDVWVYSCGVAVENVREVRFEIAAANRAGTKGTQTTVAG